MAIPRTLKSVIDANRTQPSGDVTFTADNYPTRATVVYQGKIQAIPAPRLRFLAEYLGKFRGHPEWVSHFSEEILCREGQEKTSGCQYKRVSSSTLRTRCLRVQPLICSLRGSASNGAVIKSTGSSRSTSFRCQEEARND